VPITQFYHVVITFADAGMPPVVAAADTSEQLYQLVENTAHQWTVWEQGQLATLTEAQQTQLARMLAALASLPDPNTLPPITPGADGSWTTVDVRRSGNQVRYRWWGPLPTSLQALGAVTEYVRQIADGPRQEAARQQALIAQHYFACLATRDLPGMLAHCHPNIVYQNRFVELNGKQVVALWRTVWRELPDLRVICRDSDIRGSIVYWQVTYTYPPTGRRVELQISAALTFADGLIIRHSDRFNAHNWARQAYGVIGQAFGGWRLFERWVAARLQARIAAGAPDEPDLRAH
jgi:ketosteroid isomerase-like protein